MILQAIILGVVQGLSEFLPISSSAHLLLVPYFFKWSDPGLGFDVALHWGTLVAVVGVFWRDYWRYFAAFLRTLYKKDSWTNPDSRLAWMLILASVPGALMGLLFEKQAETVFRNPLITVFTLAGFGFILWLADRKAVHTPTVSPPLKGGERGGMEGLTWLKALGIGLAQAVAIIPGVSRSGATMTAGLLSKLDRESATKFSFLLMGPIVFGAGLVSLRHIGKIDTALLSGFIAALVSGVIAIRFMLKYVSRHNFNIFVWYRYILAAVILITIFLRK